MPRCCLRWRRDVRAVLAAVVVASMAASFMAIPVYLRGFACPAHRLSHFVGVRLGERSRWTQTRLHRSAGAIQNPATTETVSIEMSAPLDGKLGIALQGGRRTVSRLVNDDAYTVGWRVGDVVVEVNGVVVPDNEAVKASVKQALADNKATGEKMRFVVKRRPEVVDTSRSMLRMTPGTGGGLTMPMRDLVLAMTRDFKVVVFLDGTRTRAQSNLSAQTVEILDKSGIAYKAVDCSDEKYNPGVHTAVEELSGEYLLPQLYIGGTYIGGGYRIQELQNEGELIPRMKGAGAAMAEDA